MIIYQCGRICFSKFAFSHGLPREVFIGNLPQEVDEEALNELFGRAGPIISCRVAKDPDTQRYKGSPRLRGPQTGRQSPRHYELAETLEI